MPLRFFAFRPCNDIRFRLARCLPGDYLGMDCSMRFDLHSEKINAHVGRGPAPDERDFRKAAGERILPRRGWT
jgi:hypothetical protein